MKGRRKKRLINELIAISTSFNDFFLLFYQQHFASIEAFEEKKLAPF